MVTIFDLRHTQTSDSIPTCFSVLPDSENMVMVVGISLLSYIQAEIYDCTTLHKYYRFMAPMFDLPVTPTSEGICTSPTVLLDSENVTVVVGIPLLSDIQAEIYDIAYVVNGGHV